MFKGFKEFILRGNVIDLAVGVVIGSAFGAIVTALVKDLLTPLIAAVAKVPDFSNLSFTINNSKFMYGDFLNAVISFLLIATAVYFFIVLPINTVHRKFRKDEHPPEHSKKICPECASEIPIDAKRCPFCTQPIK